MDAMELIELRDIVKTYHRGDVAIPVLRGITATIGRGEMVALMGTSGSGKSTLMNILGCLDRPTSGEYRLDGRDVSGLGPDERALIRNRQIGFVFQNFNLLPRTSAIDNVAMPLSYSHEHLSDRAARRQAREMLAKVGLEGRMDHEPSQLSGGQQRVAIARALINRPSIVFADEPTGNLDSKTSVEVLDMFQTLNRESGITVVLVTHDAGVARHARRVIRIQDGAIIDDAPAAEPEPAASPFARPKPHGEPA